MPELHPQVSGFMARLAGAGAPPLYTLTPGEARAASMRPLLADGPAMSAEEDLRVPVDGGEITVRRYRPVAEEAPGAIAYFHGGGWVIGDLESHEPICRELAARSGCDVFSVDYRLAPEFPFPVPVEDSYAALRYIAAQTPEDQPLAVCGDSAGGNLAAVCALRARDDANGPKIAFQALVYPVTDADLATPSYAAYGDAGLLLGLREMEWFWDHYADAEDRAHPDASPLRAGSLAGLPPALILIAEHDPLRDEGLAYAERLAAEGVPAEVIVFGDMPHAFWSMLGVFERTAEAADVVGGRIRAALAAAAG